MREATPNGMRTVEEWMCFPNSKRFVEKLADDLRNKERGNSIYEIREV